jgi:hypothetical protein
MSPATPAGQSTGAGCKELKISNFTNLKSGVIEAGHEIQEERHKPAA